MKGALILFVDPADGGADYARDSEKFYNPNIEKASVTIAGKPNQLYAGGMLPHNHFKEIQKYFADGKHRNSKFQVDGDPVDYIEQQFDHDPGLTDRSISRGNALAAIGSFVLDTGYDLGFFRAGVSRISDSIRTYAWAILVSQSQARNRILGRGKAFDAQKQFITNVEDAINSEVDLPSSKDRYQRTLQYARSSIESVLSGPNLTLELSTIGLLKKTSFFLVVLRPPRKKQVFSRQTSVIAPKLDLAQRELILYYLRLDSERFNLCSYLRENKAQTSKTKAES